EIIYKNIIYLKNILYKSTDDLSKLIELLKKNSIVTNSKLIFNLDSETFLKIFGRCTESYSIVEMEFEVEKIERKESVCSNFKFEHLNITNKFDFKEIVNESFELVPNSKTIDDMEVQEYIEDINMENEYLIITELEEKIGFVEIKGENEVAEVSLGFIKQARGKNKGILLLYDIAAYLKNKKIEKMKLFCASNNYRAYNLYEKFGFKTVIVTSKWSY
ncbi:MAG: GNAT family N-acetyltransferase, partial [Sarcina sp.]